MADLPEHIEQKIAEIVETEGLFLLEIIRRGQLNSTVLEIIVDSEKGANLETLAHISRTISKMLDQAREVIKGGYRLDVSTPGLDRPLKHNWQFRKNIERLLRVTWQGEEEHRTDLFRLLSTTDSGLTLEIARKGTGKKTNGRKKIGSAEPIFLSFEQIERVTVEPEI